MSKVRAIAAADAPRSCARRSAHAGKTCTLTGVNDWTVDIPMSLNRATAAGDTEGTTGDVPSLTGRAPRRFAEFALDHADAWR